MKQEKNKKVIHDPADKDKFDKLIRLASKPLPKESDKQVSDDDCNEKQTH